MKQKKKIRSISLENFVDDKLLQDSKEKGMSVSANVAQILYEYFRTKDQRNIKKSGNVLRSMNI